MRAMLLLALISAVLDACAPIRREPPAYPVHLDGLQRELMACDAEAESSNDPGEAYDACLAIHGLSTNQGGS